LQVALGHRKAHVERIDTIDHGQRGVVDLDRRAGKDQAGADDAGKGRATVV